MEPCFKRFASGPCKGCGLAPLGAQRPLGAQGPKAAATLLLQPICFFGGRQRLRGRSWPTKTMLHSCENVPACFQFEALLHGKDVYSRYHTISKICLDPRTLGPLGGLKALVTLRPPLDPGASRPLGLRALRPPGTSGL